MNSSMITASVTAGQLQQKLDTISNNIANVNTTGFKRREVTFSDLLHQQINNQTNPNYEMGRLTPAGLRSGVGAKVASTALRLDQGSLVGTDRELDFAITQPNHFFRIGIEENGEQIEYLTRDGAFYLSEDPDNPDLVTIVTSNGDFLLNGGFERISFPLDFEEIQLSPEGMLNITLNDGTVLNAGQLALTHVHKPQLLEAAGNNLYRLPDFAALGYAEADMLEEVPGNEGRLMQGSLEASNVDLGREMNELLTTQRHYQFTTRAMSIADEMAGLVNGIRR
ncbi:flagellar hook-basal body protein [Halalkalibacter oceani]|uniref:Flagellar hook-basal body protein n=1 Tax=Halalkalibacter oceani TaxID=1653776 RepID=A0A9X2IMW8_9BACI|nr:flagellar hook-basal body protein [Halalkalibacter oceani]MCM3714319.1 flagellar hook-basal body protein [Halalkalibacter oceani]